MWLELVSDEFDLQLQLIGDPTMYDTDAGNIGVRNMMTSSEPKGSYKWTRFAPFSGGVGRIAAPELG